MGKENFSSIEEIDAALEEEFTIVDDNDIELDLSDDNDDDEEGKLDNSEDDSEDKEPKKPSKEDQQQYAFAKLREEKLQAERKASEEQAFMRKLAKASGYGDDINAYRDDLEKRLVEEEARQHGVTPEVYQELAEAKAKLERFEKEKQETERVTKSQVFLKTINDVLSQYDVNVEETSQELFDSLEKAGYSIDALLSIPQPEFLIKGVLYDKLSKSSARDSKIKASVETKKIKNSTPDVKTVDELIEEEMVAYAKSRGLKYDR